MTGGAAPHEENQYLDAIRDIIATGVARGDRTGTGTIAKFGLTVRAGSGSARWWQRRAPPAATAAAAPPPPPVLHRCASRCATRCCRC